MSRSNHFPDVREFRTRLRTMGFATGADATQQPPPKAENSRKIGRSGGSTFFWGALGAGAAGVLAWLVVDMGGPGRMVTALYSAGGSSSQWASLRSDLLRLATDRADVTPNRNDDHNEELATLRRRVVMLEDMLTSSSQGPVQTAVAPHRPVATGAPRNTAAIPARKPQLSIAERFAPLSNKIDLPDTTAEPARANIESQILPMKMVSAPDKARRSRLAPTISFGLDLGAYENMEVLKKRWNLIEGRHGDILAGLAPRQITEFAADGRTAHRLIAAPLTDAMDVARRCAKLQARSVPCRQTLGTGSPL